MVLNTQLQHISLVPGVSEPSPGSGCEVCVLYSRHVCRSVALY